MGYGITAVCTVAAYTYTYTEYGFGLGNVDNTGIVIGGNCSLSLDSFNDDAGDLIDVYNVTSSGQMQLEDLHCNISASLGCNTNYELFTGLPYQQINLELIAVNDSGRYFAKNWTYFMLPPTPSQPAAPTLLSGGTQVQITTSKYSSEYGSALIGCVVAAGPTVWFPTNIPATLSSTPSQNSLPYTSHAIYAPTQNTNITVDLAAMNLAPNTVYDFWAVCYNANGQSPHSILFNKTTSSTLPTPAPQTSSSTAAASTPTSASTSVSAPSTATPPSSPGSVSSSPSVTSSAATSTAAAPTSSSSSTATPNSINSATVAHTLVFVSSAVAVLVSAVLAVLAA